MQNEELFHGLRFPRGLSILALPLRQLKKMATLGLITYCDLTDRRTYVALTVPVIGTDATLRVALSVEKINGSIPIRVHDWVLYWRRPTSAVGHEAEYWQIVARFYDENSWAERGAGVSMIPA